MSIFGKSNRDKLFKEKSSLISEHENAKQIRAEAITRAESDPDYQLVFVRAEAAKQRLDRLKKRISIRAVSSAAVSVRLKQRSNRRARR